MSPNWGLGGMPDTFFITPCPPLILQTWILSSRTQRFAITYLSVAPPHSPPRSRNFHPVWRGVAQGCKTEGLACSSNLGSCPHDAGDKPQNRDFSSPLIEQVKFLSSHL